MAPGGAFFVMALFMVFNKKSRHVDYPDVDDNDIFMYYHRYNKDIFVILRSIAEFLSLLLLVQGIEPNPGPLAYGSESSIDTDLRKKKVKPGTIPYDKGKITSLNDEDQTSTTYVDSAVSASRCRTRSVPSLDDDFCSNSSTHSSDCDTDDTQSSNTDVSTSVIKSRKYKKKRAKQVRGGPQARPSTDGNSYSSTDSDSDDLIKYRKEKVQLAWSASLDEKTSTKSDTEISEEIVVQSESESSVSTAGSKNGQVKEAKKEVVPKFTNYPVKDYAKTDDDMDCYTDLEYDYDYKVVFSPSYEKLNGVKETNPSTSNKPVPENNNNKNSNSGDNVKDVKAATKANEHKANVKPQSDIKEVTGDKNTGSKSAKVRKKTRSHTAVDSKDKSDLDSASGSTGSSSDSQDISKSNAKTGDNSDKSDLSSNSHPTSCSTCPGNSSNSHPSSCSTCPKNRKSKTGGKKGKKASSRSKSVNKKPFKPDVNTSESDRSSSTHPTSCSTCPSDRFVKKNARKKASNDSSSDSHPSSCSTCPSSRQDVSNGKPANDSSNRSDSVSKKNHSQTNGDTNDQGSTSLPTSSSRSTHGRNVLANIILVDDISISTHKSNNTLDGTDHKIGFEKVKLVDLENASQASVRSLLSDNKCSSQYKSVKSTSGDIVKDDVKPNSSSESKAFKFIEDIRSLSSLEIKSQSKHDEAAQEESHWDSDSNLSDKSSSKHDSTNQNGNVTSDAKSISKKSEEVHIEKSEDKNKDEINIEKVPINQSVKSDAKSSTSGDNESPNFLDNIHSFRSLSFASQEDLSNNKEIELQFSISPPVLAVEKNYENVGNKVSKSNSGTSNGSSSSNFDIDEKVVQIDEDDVSMLFRRGAHSTPLEKDPSTMNDDFCCKTSSSESEIIKEMDQDDVLKSSHSNMSVGDIVNGDKINGIEKLPSADVKTTEMCADALNLNVVPNEDRHCSKDIVNDAAVSKCNDDQKRSRSVSLDDKVCSTANEEIKDENSLKAKVVAKFTNYNVKDYASTDEDMDCYTDLEYDDDYKVVFSPSHEKLNDDKKNDSVSNKIVPEAASDKKSNDKDKICQNIQVVTKEDECKVSVKFLSDHKQVNKEASVDKVISHESVKDQICSKEEMKDEIPSNKSLKQASENLVMDGINEVNTEQNTQKGMSAAPNDKTSNDNEGNDSDTEIESSNSWDKNDISSPHNSEHVQKDADNIVEMKKNVPKKVVFAKSAAVRNFDSQISEYKDEKDEIRSLSDSKDDNALMSGDNSNGSQHSLPLDKCEDGNTKDSDSPKAGASELTYNNDVIALPIVDPTSIQQSVKQEEIKVQSHCQTKIAQSKEDAVLQPIARQKSFVHTFDEEFEIEASSSSMDTEESNSKSASLDKQQEGSTHSVKEVVQPIARQKSFAYTFDEQFEVESSSSSVVTNKSNSKSASLGKEQEGSKHSVKEVVQPIARQKSNMEASSSSVVTNKSNSKSASLGKEQEGSKHSVKEVVQPIARQKSNMEASSSSVVTNKSNSKSASLGKEQEGSKHSVKEVVQPIARQKSNMEASSSSVVTNKSNSKSASLGKEQEGSKHSVKEVVQPIARQKSLAYTFDEQFEVESSRSSVDTNHGSLKMGSLSLQKDDSVRSLNGRKVLQPIVRQKPLAPILFDEEIGVKSSSSSVVSYRSNQILAKPSMQQEESRNGRKVLQPIARKNSLAPISFNEEIEVKSSSFSVDTSRSSQISTTSNKQQKESIHSLNEGIQPIARQKSFVHTSNEELEDVSSSSSWVTMESEQSSTSLNEQQDESVQSRNEVIQPIARQKSFAYTFDKESNVESSIPSMDRNPRSLEKPSQNVPVRDSTCSPTGKKVLQPIARQKSFAIMVDEEIGVQSSTSSVSAASSASWVTIETSEITTVSSLQDESLHSLNEVIQPIARQKSFFYSFDEKFKVDSSSSSVILNQCSDKEKSIITPTGESKEVVQPIARQKSFVNTFDEAFEVESSSSSVDTNHSDHKETLLNKRRDDCVCSVVNVAQPISRQKSFANTFDEAFKVESSSSSVDTNHSDHKEKLLNVQRDDCICSLVNHSDHKETSLDEQRDGCICGLVNVDQPIARQKSFVNTFDEAFKVEPSSSSVKTILSDHKETSLHEHRDGCICCLVNVDQPISKEKSFAHFFDEVFEVESSSSSVDTNHSNEKAIPAVDSPQSKSLNECVQSVSKELIASSSVTSDSCRLQEVVEQNDTSKQLQIHEEIAVPVVKQNLCSQKYDKAFEVESSSSVKSTSKGQKSLSLSKQQNESTKSGDNNITAQAIINHTSVINDTFDEVFEVKSSSSVNSSSLKSQPAAVNEDLDNKSNSELATSSYSLRPSMLNKQYADNEFESPRPYSNTLATTFQDLSEMSSCYNDKKVVDSHAAAPVVKDVVEVAIQVDKVKYTLVANKKTQVEDICNKQTVDKGMQYEQNEMNTNKDVEIQAVIRNKIVDKGIQYELNYFNTIKDQETQVEDLSKKEVTNMSTQVERTVVCSRETQVESKPTEEKGIQFEVISGNVAQNKEIQVDTIYRKKTAEKETQSETKRASFTKMYMDKDIQTNDINKKQAGDKFVQTDFSKHNDVEIVKDEHHYKTSQNMNTQVEESNGKKVENKRNGSKRKHSKKQVTSSSSSDEDQPIKDNFNKGIQVEDDRCREVHEDTRRQESFHSNGTTINIQNMVINMNQVQAGVTDSDDIYANGMDIEGNKSLSGDIIPHPPCLCLKVYSISSPIVQNSRKRQLLTEKQQKKNVTGTNYSTLDDMLYKQNETTETAKIIEISDEKANSWSTSTTEPQINEKRINRKRKWQKGVRKTDRKSVKTTQFSSDVNDRQTSFEPCTVNRDSSHTSKNKETIPACKEIEPKVKKTVTFQEPDNKQTVLSTSHQTRSQPLLVDSCHSDKTIQSDDTDGFIKNIVKLIGKEIDEALEQKMNRLDSVRIKNNHNRSQIKDETTKVCDIYADLKPEYITMFDDTKSEEISVISENIRNKNESPVEDVKCENEKKKKKKSGFIGFLRRLFKNKKK